MTIHRLIEISILVAVLWVPLQLLVIPSAGGVSPHLRRLLALIVTAYLSWVISIIIFAPDLLGPLAILAGAGFAYAVGRSRPSYGSRRRYPPGSLGLRSSLQALTDYHFYEKQAHRHGPIFKMSQYHRPVVCIVGLSRAREFLRRHREHLTPAALPINRLLTGGLLRYMDPDRHKVYRRLLQSCMTAQVIRDCEPFIVDQARVALSTMASGGSQVSTAGVRPDEHIDRMVFAVSTRVFFGFRPDEKAVPTLMGLYRIVDHRRIFRRAATTRRALGEIEDIVREQAERFRHQRQAAPSCFLAEAVRRDPTVVGDVVFLENLIYFLHIARCDLAGLLAWTLKMACDHPEWGLRLRAELGRPDHDRASDNLSERFIAETLRLRQSEYLYRTTSHPLQFEGFLIPRGWLVRICIRESHRTGDVFGNPLGFDPDRFLTPTTQDEYQPFGAYEHACLGVYMTKAIARIFVEQLVRGFDWAVVGDGPMELGLYHHGHWKPSSSFRIRLVPLQSHATLQPHE